MHCFKIAVLLAAHIQTLIWAAAPRHNARAFDSLLMKRQSSNDTDSLVVDLGYERYRGVSNQTTRLNTWKG